MTSLATLRAERARDVDALEELINKAEFDERRFTAAEDDQFRALTTRVTAIDDQLAKVSNMDTDTPQGTLRSLVAVPTKLSDGLPADIASQVERSGRVSYEVKSSLRVIARNVIGESVQSPNVAIAGPTSWRIADGGIPYTPSLLELLPVVPVTGSGILQHVLDYTPPDQAGNHAAEVPEAQVKPESSVEVKTTAVTFPTWAHFLVCTRQALSDIPSLRALVDGILLRGLLRRVDEGIYATLSAVATTYAPPSGVTGSMDTAVMALSHLAAIGARSPTVLLNPADLAMTIIAKCAGSGCYLGQPPGAPGRIVGSPAIPAGSFLAFSAEAAFIAERESATVVAGVYDDQFIRNLITLLAEWRGIAVLQQPAYLLIGSTGTGTVTPPEQVSARHAGGPRRG